jgi:hypothetical protein
MEREVLQGSETLPQTPPDRPRLATSDEPVRGGTGRRSQGFAVVDGCPFRDHVRPRRARGRSRQVVLASDGYLSAAPALHQAEHQLATSLDEDPPRIGEYASTKAVAPGARSFDDRTYVRLRTF